MQPDCIISSNISVFSDFITWLLVIIGWVIINHQQNVRETRKELRCNVDKIKQQLVSIEKDAIAYHTTVTPEGSLSSDIRLAISRVSTEIKLLALLEAEVQKILIKDFRKAITLNNFDSHSHKAYDYGSELIFEVSSSVDEITTALEKAFRKKYPR